MGESTSDVSLLGVDMVISVSNEGGGVGVRVWVWGGGEGCGVGAWGRLGAPCAGA